MAEACLPGRPADSSKLGGDPSLFLSRVWEMCQGDGPFCDLQLQFGDETRQGGNSLVLAALSPFFEAMLTTDMKERTGHVVQLPTISQSTFRQVLAFSLGLEMAVEEREEELVELLQAADMLQLWPLKDACGQALTDRLTQDNCLDTLHLVNKFSLNKFKKRVEKYTSACLDQVYKGYTWVSLKEAEVSGVIRTRGLCDSSMDTKAAAVLRWLQENKAEADTTGRLLGLLSLEQLSFDFLLDVMLPHPCVLQCPSVLQAVKECMRTKAAAGTRQEPVSTSAVQAYAEPAPFPVSYVFIFNNDNGKLEICEWLTKEQVWVSCLKQNETLLSCAPEACSGQLILSTQVIENKQTVSRFLHYEVKGRYISCRSPFMSGLSHLAGAVGDLVFVVDGKEVKEYFVKSKFTRKMGSILVGVSDPGVAVMGDLLVVVGGRGDKNQNNLIQTFHTKTNQASVAVHRLPEDMTRVKFAGHHQGKSYFIGDGGDLVGLVERQGEVMVDTQVMLQRLENRSGFSAFTEVGGITVCGGKQSTWSYNYHTLTSSATSDVTTYDYRGRRTNTAIIPSLPEGMHSCHIFPVY